MTEQSGAVEAGGVSPAGQLLPHQEFVEDVLGVPLLPQHVPYELTPDPDLPDIRVKVHDLIVNAAQFGRRRKMDEAFLATKRRQVSERAGDLIVQARRRVVIANNVADSVDRPAFVPPGVDSPGTPRSLLQTAMGRAIYDFTQRPHTPKLPGAEKGPLAPLRSGMIIVSATATGKTVPIAEDAQRSGVGQPFAEVDPQINRLLVVVPSARLLKQYMDPDETMRRWLPDIEFTDYWHRAHNVGGGVQVVLDDSLETALASGAINLDDYPTRVIDEGHRAGSSRMLKQLGAISAGRLMLCTATPKEMRRYFADFTASTARSAAEQGITRPVRLVTYQHGPERGDVERKTAQIAAQVIRSGRQIGIYCRTIRGSPDAQQARDVAELINLELRVSGYGEPDQEYVKVIAGVSGDEANEQAEADFRAGKLRAYTAIGMLGEGVNLPMDALLVVGGRSGKAQWLVDQIAGRLPRPIFGVQDYSKAGWLIEMQPREIPSGEPLASIWRTYGFEDDDIIEQGAYIGAPLPGEGHPDELRDLSDSEEVSGQTPPPPHTPAPSGQPQGEPSPTPPAPHSSVPGELRILDEMLAPPSPLRTITIAPEDWAKYEKPVVGSESLSALAAKFNVPEIWLHRKLDELSSRGDLTVNVEQEGTEVQKPIQITYAGVRNPSDDERKWEFERWYGPDTVMYLDQNPPTPLAEAELMDISDVAEMCGASRSYIERIINTLEAEPLPHVERLGRTNRPTRHYRMPEIEKVIAKVEETPVADPKAEEALSDLGQELGDNFVYNFVRTRRNDVTVNERRRHPDSGINGFARHISKADAARMREAYYNPPVATTNDISVAEMARRAGVTLGGMIKRIEKIPEDNRPDIRPLKPGPKGRAADHMDRSEGLAIVEQARVRKLLPDKVTLGMLAKYFNADRKTVTTRMRTLRNRGMLPAEEAQPEAVNLGGQGGEVSAWSWRLMQTLEERGGFELPDGAERVDYRRVTQGPYGLDHQYSQQVQSRLGDSSKLIKLPSRDQVRPIHPQIVDAVEVSVYAEGRETTKDNILEIIATGTAGDVVLYAQNETSGDPVFLLDKDDTHRLDQHLGFAPSPEEQGGESLAVTEAHQDTSPQAAIEWVDRDTAQTQTGADKYAFALLLRAARISEQDILRDKEGMIIGFSPLAMQAMDAQVRQISAPQDGWIRLAMIAQHGASEPAEAFDRLMTMEEEQNRPFSEDEVRFCRRGKDVEIYASNKIGRAVQRWLRQNRSA